MVDRVEGPDGALVRAAGGAVWRRSQAGALETVLVHRRSYDDWSLPKGKVDPGESDEAAALREVEEETSLVCRLGPELVATHYADRLGRAKVVRYWAMVVEAGTLAAAHEIDDARWLTMAEARSRLSYERDREVLDALEAALL